MKKYKANADNTFTEIIEMSVSEMTKSLIKKYGYLSVSVVEDILYVIGKEDNRMYYEIKFYQEVYQELLIDLKENKIISPPSSKQKDK